MNGIRPQPPEGGDPLREVRRKMQDSDGVTDSIAGMVELRVAQLEEVAAARWPRRWLLAARLRRQLRASVRGYGWVDGSWTDRRSQAVTDDWLASQERQEGQQ